jgi:selenide,water dikinase
VLTKPIGTGVVATAVKRGSPDPAHVAAAVEAMTTLNAAASTAALDAGVRAATDVTGFGLLGHLHRMLRASGAAARVAADRVPLLPGAAELTAAGFVSGGTRNNLAYLAGAVTVEDGVPAVTSTLLHDAQTSGGLLLAVPPAAEAELLGALAGAGVAAAVIGEITRGEPGAVTVAAS